MKKTPLILFAIGLLLSACAFREKFNAASPTPTAIQTIPETLPSSATPASPAFTVHHVAGSTKKICQLTGDLDRQTGQPTINLTQTNFGVRGTDLGFSFLHEGRTYFLFGDTIGDHGGDSIAYTQDTQPDDCLELTFVTGPDERYLPPSVPGISLEAFEVPVGGFSANGAMYVFFTTDHTETRIMGRSVLARSDDAAQSFAYLYDVSTDKFINLVPVIVDNASIPSLPETTGQGLLVWGTGTYRQSNSYLAYVPLDQVEDRRAWSFYAGLDPETGAPTWSADEAEAADLFVHPRLGEFSVAWNEDLAKWLMFYNSSEPRGITLRSADAPWGSWSDGEIIFDPWEDGGYCDFMHVSHKDRNCDSVQDPGRDDVWAGEYGPYIIPSLAHMQDGVTTVYFVLSTWNPYAVMLMKVNLILTSVP